MNTKTKSCLQCGEPRKQRGLCQKCYSRYRNALYRLETRKRKPFEQALIEAGKILPKGKREPDSYDPFGELADELETAENGQIGEVIEDFRTRQQQSQKPTVQQEAADVVEKAKRRATRKGITPKDKKQP